MKTLRAGLIGVTLTLLLGAPALAQTGHDLLQQALVMEQAEGDLQAAIQLYERIADEFAADRELVARALVQMGQCYEKLGSTEAERAYQRVVSDFADQTDFVAQARARLAALRAAPTATGRPVARMLLSSANPADKQIENPRGMVPSPDGRRVAYYQSAPDTKGLYVRDLTTGDVQQVASGQPTVDLAAAVWSADGKRLAFTERDTDTKASVIQILDLSSLEIHAVPVRDTSRLYLLDWTRDGRYLLCNRQEGQTLELVAVGDGTMTTLSENVWFAQRASFSPDGRFVAYGAGPHGQESLYVQSLADGSRHSIAESGGQMYLHPMWSPDGSAIAHQQADGIWVVPVTDGVESGPPRLAYRTDSPRWAVAWTAAGGLHFTAISQRNVPMQVEVDPSNGRAAGSGARELAEFPQGLQSFRWDPDRRRAVLTGWGNDLTVYSTETKAVTSYDPVEPDGMVQGGMWSPDGRELWYQYVPASRAGSTMKALDLASGQARELFPPLQAGGFSLSADASTIAFVRAGSAGGSLEIVVAEMGQADGRVVATLPGPDGLRLNRFALPMLSPRADQVLYVGDGPSADAGPTAPDAGAIWVVGSDGVGARRLTTAPQIFSAAWDPSGRFIAYTGKMADTTNTFIRVVDVETGAEHNIPMPSTETMVRIMDWSRDGRFIGLVRMDVWWEYWTVQGLLGEAR